MEPIRIDHRLHSISLRFSIPPNIRTGGWQGTTRQDHFHLQKGRAFLPSILTLLVKIVAGLNPYLPVYSDASSKHSTWDTTTANYPLRPYLAASKINSGMSCHTTGSSSFVFETKMNLYFDRPSSSTFSLIRSSKLRIHETGTIIHSIIRYRIVGYLFVVFFLLACETGNELFILFRDHIVVVLQSCSFSLLLFFHCKYLLLMMNQNARVEEQFCIERTCTVLWLLLLLELLLLALWL